MKNLHQNLLVVFALSLCGLCAYQWYGQTLQQTQFESLSLALSRKAADLQGLTNSLSNLNSQIAQMDTRISELRQTVNSNEQSSSYQKREITRLRVENASLTNGLAEYKAALGKVEAKLQEAYAGITKQNEAVNRLVAQRDEFVQKYNESVKDRNDVVNKYNELVQQVEKKQGASAPPPGK